MFDHLMLILLFFLIYYQNKREKKIIDEKELKMKSFFSFFISAVSILFRKLDKKLLFFCVYSHLKKLISNLISIKRT